MIEAYERTRRQHHRGRGGAGRARRTNTASCGVEDGRDSRITGWSRSRKAGTAPSNLAISGRYILQPEIFDLLERQERGAGGEIQITDAMIKLSETQAFHAARFDGAIYDCGSKLGFLTANVAYALDREDLAGPLRREIEALLRKG